MVGEEASPYGGILDGVTRVRATQREVGMDQALMTLLVMGAAIALFVWNRLPVGVVALLTALSLLALGIVDLDGALGGFGDPVVLFLAGLFVVAEGLDASGITAWIARTIAARAHGEGVLLVLLMLVTALLSALITPNGAAAAMIPVTLSASRALGVNPARLLMPLAFAASAGALLTMSGSVVNVLVSQSAQEAGAPGFAYLDFAVAGVPLVVGTILVSLVGRRLIPGDRESSIAKDFGGHVEALIDHYELEQGFHRLTLTREPDRRLTARTLGHQGSDQVGIYAVQSSAGEVRGLDETLHQGDALLVAGGDEQVEDLVREPALRIADTPLRRSTRSKLVHAERGIAEVIVPPRSMLTGQVVFTGMRRGMVTVLGIRHQGRDVATAHVEIAEGDTLLLHGPWPALHQLEEDHDVLFVDCPEDMRRQVVPLGRDAWIAGGITAVMVLLLATGVVPPAVSALLAACAMVVAKVLTPVQAYRAVSWQTIVLIGALIPLSTAIRTSGAADLLARGVLTLAGSGSVQVVLAVVFVVTALLGQFISNTATALVMVPVVMAIAQTSGLDVRVLLMSLAVASGASLLTPIATPANMMVGAAAGYHFGDFTRFGALVMAVWFVVAVLLVPVVVSS